MMGNALPTPLDQPTIKRHGHNIRKHLSHEAEILNACWGCQP